MCDRADTLNNLNKHKVMKAESNVSVMCSVRERCTASQFSQISEFASVSGIFRIGQEKKEPIQVRLAQSFDNTDKTDASDDGDELTYGAEYNKQLSREPFFFSFFFPRTVELQSWHTSAGYLLSMSEMREVGLPCLFLPPQASLAGNYTPSPLLIKSSASVHQKINTAPRTHPLEWSWLVQNQPDQRGPRLKSPCRRVQRPIESCYCAASAGSRQAAREGRGRPVM